MVDGANPFIYIHEIERRACHLALNPQRMRKALDKECLAGAKVAFKSQHGPLPDFLSDQLGQMGSLLGRIRSTGKHVAYNLSYLLKNETPQ